MNYQKTLKRKKNRLVRRLKGVGVVNHSPHIGTSGIKLTSYCDIKLAYGYPDCINLISDLLAEQIDERTTCVAGKGEGGRHLAAVFSSRQNIPVASIRDEPKDWGTKKWIEGYNPTRKDKITILDDVYVTGKSLMEAREIITPTGAEIIGHLVVVKRPETEPTFPLKYILTLDDLL